jgi:hypothetical protein
MNEKYAGEVTLVRRSRSEACGLSHFSRHLANELRARGVSVADHNLPDQLDCKRQNTIVHYVPSMWSGAAETFDKVLRSAFQGRLMVMIHGLYTRTDLTHMSETPCPDLPSHVASIASRADCVVGLSHSCSELYSEWVEGNNRARASIATLLHPGLAKATPREIGMRNYVFYGGVIRPKKSIAGGEIRRLLRALRRSGLETWVHVSNGGTNVTVPEASQVSTGVCDDEEWTKMVTNALAVVCPYDSRVQCVSGVIAEAISVGIPVIATSFRFAREMRDKYPDIVLVSDNLSDWPRMILALQGREHSAPHYPNWGCFVDAVLYELGI